MGVMIWIMHNGGCIYIHTYKHTCICIVCFHIEFLAQKYQGSICDGSIYETMFLHLSFMFIFVVVVKKRCSATSLT